MTARMGYLNWNKIYRLTGWPETGRTTGYSGSTTTFEAWCPGWPSTPGDGKQDGLPASRSKEFCRESAPRSDETGEDVEEER
mmetsp:Transcript_33362/g.59768  ORF Transcript_33362/g.59768 Transcript_33362/m.59768 type:complete len:82 (+) Transcript_33362:2802-3047(+)